MQSTGYLTGTNPPTVIKFCFLVADISSMIREINPEQYIRRPNLLVAGWAVVCSEIVIYRISGFPRPQLRSIRPQIGSNAEPELLLGMGAKHEWTLEAVRSRPLSGWAEHSGGP